MAARPAAKEMPPSHGGLVVFAPMSLALDGRLPWLWGWGAVRVLPVEKVVIEYRVWPGSSVGRAAD